MPEVATPRLMGAVFGVFYALGGVAGLCVVQAAGGAAAGGVLTTLALICLGAVVAGLATVALRDRLTTRTLHAVVASGTATITTGVLLAPDATSALLFAALLTFIAVDCAVFFSTAAGLVHFGTSVVAGTAALSARGDLDGWEAAALGVVLAGVAGVVAVVAKRASSASRDSLTGLPNRRGLDAALERSVRTAERTGEPLSVALLDLDGFKAVNDASGHAAGDELLRTTAATWRAALPEEAVLARLGGDEFAVVLPGGSSGALVELLAPLVGDRRAPASAGVAETRWLEGPADVLRRADMALYEVKRSGRGRCAVAGEDAATEGEAALVEDLARALRAGGLEVHYQPLYDAAPAGAAGVPRAVEALVRWHHPQHGPVSPTVFVPLAESRGLVTELGALVLERACRELMSLPPELRSDLRLSVNVSGLELVRPGYLRGVSDVLERTGWPVSRLVLEVTESVVEADAPQALATLREARALGLLISVDDFGTGYSALSRLDEVPATYLKLDCSFTATVHTSPQRARLVRAVTALSRTLDLAVVAEGVESAEQAQVLVELGCTLLQGYHLGRPEPLEALARRLVAGTAAPATAPRQGDPATAGSPVEAADV
ncbi:bifunctional diguanylate cyclase/phosphodiesterase [uncultured Pseudokineococcus sp.]|uniref:putative bifunctional diguanylate cyclase/phosphodiesterase n=1 Tax=uncultured Pseudokineococcus sp. TaxID=1642928 RepID=UPI002603D528|nr:bifunctional diguanylate cyclase/phosphodiesterase [uncultured Pseudokineococcus sp.]